MGFFSVVKSDSEKLYLTVLWGALALLYACGVPVYVWRRTHDHIAARSPLTTLGLLCVVWGNLATAYSPDLFAPRGVLCDYEWLYSFTSITFVLIFALAIWKLLSLVCAYELQRMRLSIQLYDELERGQQEEDAAAAANHNATGKAVANAPGAGATSGATSGVKPAAADRDTSANSGVAGGPTSGNGVLDPSLASGLITKPNFVQRHIALLTSRKLLAALFVYGCMDGIISLWIPPQRTPEPECLENSQTLVMWGVPPALILLVLAYLCRSVEDGFAVTTELRRQGLIAVVQVVCLMIENTVVAGGVYTPAAHIETIGAIVALWIVSIFIPLRASFRKFHRINSHSGARGTLQLTTGADGKTTATFAVPSSVATFDALLSSKAGRANFTRHLMLEFSVENLVFLGAVEQLHKTAAQTRVAIAQAALDAEEANSDAPPKPKSPTHAQQPDAAATATTAATAAVAAAPKLLSRSEAEIAREHAYDVYERFVAHGAAFAINLSFENAKPLHALFAARHLYRRRAAAAAAAAGGGASSSSGAGGSSGPGSSSAAAVSGIGWRRGSASALRLLQVAKAKRNNSSGSRPTSPNAGGRAANGAAATKYRADAAGGEAKQQPSHTAITIQPQGTAAAAAGGGRLAPLPEETLKRTGSRLAFALHHDITTGERKAAPTAAAAHQHQHQAAQQHLVDPFDTAPAFNADLYWTCFDAAATEIRTLLESDSYVRYVNGPLFAALVKRLVLAEQLANPDGPQPAVVAAAAAAAAAAATTPKGGAGSGGGRVSHVSAGERKSPRSRPAAPALALARPSMTVSRVVVAPASGGATSGTPKHVAATPTCTQPAHTPQHIRVAVTPSTPAQPMAAAVVHGGKSPSLHAMPPGPVPAASSPVVVSPAAPAGAAGLVPSPRSGGGARVPLLPAAAASSSSGSAPVTTISFR